MTKILLVEDDKSLREIYGVRLLAEGYDIVSAGDGEEALAMAIKERPSLIVSDVMMPKISGFDMLDILRSTTETKDIRVIMMTALSSEDQRKRGEELGADRYLVKSQVGIEDVVRAVHEVLADAPTSTAFPPAGSAQPVATPAPVPPTAERPSSITPPARPSTPPVVTAPATPSPTPQAPTPTPPSVPTPSELPQPTAPFSTPRPSGNSSLERIIEPISRPEEDSQDAIANRIALELNQVSNEVEPQTTAAEPAQGPQPASTPPVNQSPAPTTPVMPSPQTPPAQPPTPTTSNSSVPPTPQQ